MCGCCWPPPPLHPCDTSVRGCGRDPARHLRFSGLILRILWVKRVSWFRLVFVLLQVQYTIASEWADATRGIFDPGAPHDRISFGLWTGPNQTRPRPKKLPKVFPRKSKSEDSDNFSIKWGAQIIICLGGFCHTTTRCFPNSVLHPVFYLGAPPYI